ncbi:MFS transporter [Arcticibacter sp. MXS-1]|uniref:MFS transporter n=1 Tax=Arcticibacter sp. MXS-1 TaxID=3341726 RepID=UPI0035A8E20C
MESDSGFSYARTRIEIAGFVFLTFIGYLIIGFSLATLPVFIHQTLGYSTVVAGVVISLQYITTFFVRGYAGRIVDQQGPKQAVLRGLAVFSLSGLLLALAASCRSYPALSLSVLVVARLVTGYAEGMVGVSPVNWAMLKVGTKHTSTAISYNGIASYGALAVGAPVGVILEPYIGLSGLGILIVAIGLGGFLLARSKEGLKEVSVTARQPFMKVLGKVSPFGICLALGGLGFGTISTFITLYYQYNGWTNGALSLTVFGALFVLGRVCFSHTIQRYGGLKVSVVSLAFETVGLMLLWMAKSPEAALIGAGATGLGFSLIFPALGVEAVKRVSAANKGSALAGYGLFIDISLGITGPLVGTVADRLGMLSIFPFSMAIVFLGLLLCIYMLAFLKKEI